MAKSPISQNPIIIGCGKAKIWKRRPESGKVQAKDAYVGSLFKLSRRFAEKHSPGNWLVLSAKYGLIDPNQPISDYNVTIDSRSTVNRDRIRAQWQRLGDGRKRLVCLASKRYVALLRESLPTDTAIETPLNHLDLFERTKWLKHHS